MNALIKKQLRKSLTLAAFTSLTVCSVPSQAVVSINGCGDAASKFGLDCSLAELLAGGSIQVGDTFFEGFSGSLSSSSGTVSEADIKVVGSGAGTSDRQLRFDGPGVADDDYFFDVTYQVNNISLLMNNYKLFLDMGNRLGAAGGFAAMEVVDAVSGNEIAFPEPTVDQDTPLAQAGFIDEFSTLPTSSDSFLVTTNVMLFAGQSESLEKMLMEQTFGATPAAGAPVPEPGTVLLLATGLVGLMAYKRKK